MKQTWILRETLVSEKLKKPIYFWKMTHIGPCSTPKLEDAAQFGSKQEAMMSPAYSHALSFYEPEQIEVAA